MQLEMRFVEPPSTDGKPMVWATLDDEDRAEALEMLARVIAKVVATGAAAVEGTTVLGEERSNE